MAIEVFTDMLGQVIERIDGSVGDDIMSFHAVGGRVFKFEHYQDCCEHVSIEDITGDLSDLIGSPITTAESVDNIDEPEVEADSYTWTFYRFGTAKGSITVRWLGTSNGNYSEGVSYDNGANPED